MALDSLVFRAPGSLSAPLAGTPKLRLTGDTAVVTSDTFTGSDATTLPGRTTDALLGGAAMAWTNTLAAAFGITGGKLTSGSDTTNAAFMYVTVPSASAQLLAEFTIDAYTSAAAYFDLFRDGDVGGSSTKLRVNLGTGGDYSVVHNANNVITTISGLSGGAGAFPLGSKLGISVNNVTKAISVYKNGVLLASGVGPVVYTGKKVGFARGGGTIGQLDNFKITETVL